MYVSPSPEPSPTCIYAVGTVAEAAMCTDAHPVFL